MINSTALVVQNKHIKEEVKRIPITVLVEAECYFLH